MSKSPELALLLQLMDEAYEKKAWHGTNLRGALRGLSASEAAWRPAPRLHNVWELVVHAAYWKYAVARRLTGEKRGSFPVKGSNWFRRPLKEAGGGTERAWREDIALLDAPHRRLRKIVENFPARALHRAARGGSYTAARLIAGVASHDLYHTGQIQLVKVLRTKGRG